MPSTACQGCPAGSFVPTGSFGDCTKFLCAAGTIDNDDSPSTPCQACDPVQDLYQPSTGQGECLVSSPCAAGFSEEQPLSADSNRACSPCADGLFKAEAGTGACAAWSQCGRGTQANNTPDASMDRRCQACEVTLIACILTSSASSNLFCCSRAPSRLQMTRLKRLPSVNQWPCVASFNLFKHQPVPSLTPIAATALWNVFSSTVDPALHWCQGRRKSRRLGPKPSKRLCLQRP